MTRKQLSDTSRRRVLQGTGAGAAAMLAGCLGGGGGDGNGGNGGNGGGGADPTELPDVFMLTDYNNEPWQGKWEDLSGSFTEETDIGVNIEYSGMSGQQENRLATLIQSGNPPDVNTSTFDQVADVWSTDGLATTNGVVEAAESANGELLSTPLTVDGDIWQVPHGYYVSNFHYREDVYEELGLDVPSTFQEVLENARVIDESDLDIRGYGLAGKKVGKSQDEFQVYLAHMGVSGVGVRWKDPDARNEVEAWWPEEEITTLLQFFKDIAEYSPDPTSLGWSSSISNWLGGQFAQQYHLNHWPAGIAAAADIPEVAYNTKTRALPYWDEGNVSKGDSWLWEPTPDGHHIFAGGDNTPGARQWMEYCYGSSLERSATMYQQEPTRFLPIYADVLESDTFQGFDFWSSGENQQLLDELVKIQNVQFGEHYGQVPESDVNDPVFLYVQRQWFHGEMVNRVITGTDTVQEAYEWGRGRLETRLEEARNRFR
jgi:multiple sugar transport system substrate-binding protein